MLPGENLLWKGRHIAHIELGRPRPALWVGIFGLVVTWTWNLLAPETLLGQLFQFVKTRMPGLPALVLDFAVAFGLGGLLALLEFLRSQPWSPGGILILTDRRLYFQGWFQSWNLPLVDMGLLLAAKRKLTVNVPPEEKRHFGSGVPRHGGWPVSCKP